MKRLVLTLAICLGCFGILEAQNIWKPINGTGLLGVGPDGSIFAYDEYGKLTRSQDDGETWQIVLGQETGFTGHINPSCFAVSNEERIFVFNDNQQTVVFSDDNGDTWQQTPSMSSCAMPDKTGLCAPTNNLLVVWAEEGEINYSLDGGETWDGWIPDFMESDNGPAISDLLVNENGDVYLGLTSFGGDGGISHSTLSNIQNWDLVAFEGISIKDMAFDPEGNVVACGYNADGSSVGFQHIPGFYLFDGTSLAISDGGIVYSLHNVSYDYNLYMVLNYSGDHGETFYDYGEALSIQQNAPGGEGDGYLWKGRDGHLYFYGHGAYKKSVFNTNDIHYIEGEVVAAENPYVGTTPVFTQWMAIRTAENHDYYVTVDGFRQNPWEEERLAVRYDTIPVGTVIGAFGTIKQMSDDEVNYFDVIDIQQTSAHYYDAITAMLDPTNDKVLFQTPRPPYQTYYITIDGEQQNWPLVFNGVTYDNSDLQTFIGHCSIQTDSYGNQFLGMELKDIQSFIDCNIIYNGTITTNFQEPICLTLPCEDEHVLTVIGPPDWVYPNTPYYPTHNGFLYRDTYINNDIFRENMQVVVKGIQHEHFDIRGWNAITYELVEIDTDEETTLTGTVEMVPMPYTSYIPVPGLALAFISNGKTYYLDNQHEYYDNYFILGNDTIYEGQEITATFTSKMLIDNGLNFYYRININEAEVLHPILPPGAEWYYEIQNENGSITYQYLYQAGDTIINDEPTHILVKINTLYDKDLHQDVSHEYVYERDGKLYWWNKTLEEFTVLYDFGAQEGDSWVIKVGTETLTMHVDAVEEIEYEGRTYRMLRVSDPEDLFSGNIVCGIGHLTSFFPERLMGDGDRMRVEGMRCYWTEGELVFKYGDEDCDAVYSEVHGVEEDGPSTGSRTLTVYPNPTNGVLFVQTLRATSLPAQTYRITNLMGQTLLAGQITNENQQINVSSLPQGMYFITIAGETRKFVVNY